MIQNLKRPSKSKCLKRLDGKNFTPRKSLCEFVTAKTMNIFEALLPDGAHKAEVLFQKMPEDWDEDPIYIRFQTACDNDSCHVIACCDNMMVSSSVGT